MFHRIKEVKPIRKYILQVLFVDGTEKIYDMEPIFSELEIFNSIRITTGLFEQVKVDTGGYGISWNEDIVLSCDELWDNGNKLVIFDDIYCRDTGASLSYLHNPNTLPKKECIRSPGIQSFGQLHPVINDDM